MLDPTTLDHARCLKGAARPSLAQRQDLVERPQRDFDAHDSGDPQVDDGDQVIGEPQGEVSLQTEPLEGGLV